MISVDREQATSKKDLVTLAPEGAHFVSTQSGGAFRHSELGSRTRRLGGAQDVDENDEGEDDDENGDISRDMGMGPEGFSVTTEDEEAALARAQTESMDMATQAHFSQNRMGDEDRAAVGGHVLGGPVCSAGMTLGGGDLRQLCESQGALDAATLASIHALDLSSVRIPAELLDPLTQQLMMDPVKLPCSGSTVDRSTIMRHLRTTPTDPYTNTPLALSDVTPATDLLPKYKAWLSRCQAAC